MKATGRTSGRYAAPFRAWTSLLWIALSTHAADWPAYRGPTHDGVSTDRLQRNWTGSVTNPLWVRPLTNCLGSLVVAGGRVFTQTRRLINGSSTEACVALDSTNGNELWATPVDGALYPQGGVGFDDGPRSTPAVDGGSVFLLSSYLKLYRLNATNGAVIWRKDLRALYGGDVIEYQNTASPLLEGGLIFLNANCHPATLLALHPEDGSLAWRAQDESMTHSTPTPATLHGVRQILFATQSGLVSVDPATGTLLWRFPYPFQYFVTLGMSPVVSDDVVFIGGGYVYGMGSMAVEATLNDGVWTATALWSTNNPSSHWMTPVAYQGFLYGQFGIQSFDSVNAQLKCIDILTGQVRWSVNGFGRGATMLVDGHLVVLTEQGSLVLVRPDPNGYAELGRFLAVPGYSGITNKCWNIPAVADGRVFVRSTAYVAAFDLSVPSLRIDPPQPVNPGVFDVTIRTVTGAPLSADRAAALAVLATTNLHQSLTQWSPLTNPAVLTGGVVRVRTSNQPALPEQYFIVSEPK